MIKQALVLLLGLLVIGVGAYGVNMGSTTSLSNDSFLRIHIRANSNLEADQNVKYLVKDAVVNFLTPKLAFATTKERAMEIVEQNKAGITAVASKVLEENGFPYGASTTVHKEEFPTRAYDDVVLPSGEYDSVIVSLGSGTGNNWWCVVYPPLCFVNAEQTDNESVVYKSKLIEVINSFFGGNHE